MQTKKCNVCEIEKPISDFSRHVNCRYGVRPTCNKCRKDYTKTKEGHIEQSYRNQIARSIIRGHPPPDYSLRELTEHVMAIDIYHTIHGAWEESGYDIWLAPSFDRIDDYKPYSLDNIQVTTWCENNKRYYQDLINGINTKKCKGVSQYDLDGNFIAEYYSVRHADRQTGVNQAGISRVCRGEAKTAGGFIWKFF